MPIPNGMKFNTKAFQAGLKNGHVRMRRGAMRGVQLVANHTERKCKEVCPVKHGTLAGSIVAGDARLDGGQIKAGISAGGGEAADYAVRQHEVPMAHSNPHSGTYASKYIENPIKESKSKIGPTVAGEIKKELG